MRIKPRFPIRVGRSYYTEDGRKIRIYATDGGEKYPIHGSVWKETESGGFWDVKSWGKCGKMFTESSSCDDIAYEEWVPRDKDPVWCWNDEDEFMSILKFFDSKNNATFAGIAGVRNGATYHNYAPYEGELPKWLKKAQEKLKD